MTDLEKHHTYDFIWRTTFDRIYEGDLPYFGVYVIAYMGKVLYVGKVENGLTERLVYHMKYGLSPIGCWLNIREFEWPNIRLDIIVPPAKEDDRDWLNKTENACIKRFKPLFNKQLMPEKEKVRAFGNQDYQNSIAEY